jgi:hypothetical protein
MRTGLGWGEFELGRLKFESQLLVERITMKNNATEADTSVVLSTANNAIAQYYDFAVKSFIETRASR